MNKFKELFNSNQKFQKGALLFISAGLLIYVALRAWFLSFTFDEVVSADLMKTFSWAQAGETANNHLLNILLMKWSAGIFGESEFALRLPNVLAFVLYLVAAIKINKLLKMPYLFTSLILLTCMPFVMDFFSLARGYGLGLGLMMVSLYFMAAHMTNRKLINAVISLVFAWLALLANYTLMNYLVPLAFVFLASALLDKVSLKRKGLNFVILLALTVACIGSVLPILLELKEGGRLYFGGRSDIFTDTISSLGRCFAYFTSYGLIAKYLFIILFCAAIFVAFLNLFNSVKKLTLDVPGSLSLIFLLSLLSPIAQNILFKTVYPVERTALMYYPLMVLTLFQGGRHYSLKGLRWAHLVLLFFFSAHFFMTMNFTHCYSWRYDSGTKSAMRYLKQHVTHDTWLGVDYEHMMSASFYRLQMNLGNLNLQQVSEGWDYPNGFEELDPYYFGAEEYSKSKTNYDVRNILKPGITYYYLDEFYLNELEKKGVPFRILASYHYSRSALIEVAAAG